LRRGEALVAVEPQVFDVLEYLVRNRDRVVSKDDLIAGVWDGRMVSDSTLSSRMTAVRQALGDSGERQRLIRTVSRKGFRFVGALRQVTDEEPQGKPEGTALPLPDKPSIAVLPFANLSGDAEQEYFADGMVEEVITELARMPGLFVIARNSSFAYKGRPVDVRQVGRDLGVRYVLEGSLRKAGGRVRIAAQLIDALSGVHLWADRFEGPLENVFELQDQVSISVTSAITPKVQQAEIERAKRKRTANLDAYDYYLRGLASLYQWNREAISEALRLFQRATEIDPDFSSAYGMAAYCYVRRKGDGCIVDPAKETAEAGRLARRAVELGKDDPIALAAGGFALAYVVGELNDGAAYIERALALSPNHAPGWIFSGWVEVFRGDLSAAIGHLNRAMRLTPLDPLLPGMHAGIAFAHFLAGRHDEASSSAERALRDRPNYLFGCVIRAVSQTLAGRREDAKRSFLRVRELDPKLRISDLIEMEPLRRAEHREIWTRGLREAGLPE
jgi:TolB-like protein/Flp pilus assembly protein TadD